MTAPPAGALRATDAPGHVLTVPVSDEQVCETTAEFLAGGLAAGERVSYFDDGLGDAVLARLWDDGVEIDGALRSGQFQLVPPEFTRAALLAPVDDLWGLLEQNIQSAVDDGWAGLRFTGQMSHGLTRPGGDVLAEFDQILDAAMAGRPARALCVYDHQRFPDTLIARMRELHEVEHVPTPLYDDSLLRVTGIGPARVRMAGEVDHSNRPQLRRVLDRLVDGALRGDLDADVLTLDLASLRFCDVAAAVSLVHAAEELPVTLRLRLEHVRPGVVRLLERCGASFAPQLELDVREPIPLTTPDALELAAGAGR